MSQDNDSGITFDDPDSTTRLAPVRKVVTKNILIVGLTGSGKSSIIESLCNPGQMNMVKMSPKSVTQNLSMYLDNKIVDPTDSNKEYIINLFDTVGLGDGTVDVPIILRQIIEVMPKELSKIHKIVFCFKMDRLRAFMSQELTMVYNFFKLVGAKPSNFVVCLTFCDILNDKTIGQFWNELKKMEDLPMTEEVKSVTYTSFPNLSECDNDVELIKYIRNKIERSKLRIFNSVVVSPEDAFFPHDVMVKMTEVDFKKLCDTLRTFRNNKKHWFWGMFRDTDQEEMLKVLNTGRQQVSSVTKGKGSVMN
jgi:GTP-binding protein EngB required for normal cell division